MKNKAKAKDQSEFMDAVNARMAEYFDGHVVAGFHAVTGQPFIVMPKGQDVKTILALNCLLTSAVR